MICHVTISVVTTGAGTIEVKRAAPWAIRWQSPA